MTCLVAVLEEFASRQQVQEMIRNVLKSLFKLTTNGEEILQSQYVSRLNSWRSLACIRGISHRAEKCKLDLVQSGSVQSGHVPPAESKHLEGFLLWLLATNDTCFNTPSSDIPGIAVCLCDLGFDILHVQGRGFSKSLTHENICTVNYFEEPFLHDQTSILKRTTASIARSLSITIPLERPWESVSIFPVSIEIQNKCRCAWISGQRAAKAIKLGIQTPLTTDMYMINHKLPEVAYAFVDAGQTVKQKAPLQPGLDDIATKFGLFKNQELMDELHKSLSSVSNSNDDMLSFTNLGWLCSAIDPEHSSLVIQRISAPESVYRGGVDLFCVFQSFLMGYYYDVFGRLVDTSSLILQTVEGAWGFRSDEMIRIIVQSFINSIKNTTCDNGKSQFRLFSRKDLWLVLSMMFMGDMTNMTRAGSGCMGMVGRRTLLINSLLGKCSSPRDIGGFTLLDLDVGGILGTTAGL